MLPIGFTYVQRPSRQQGNRRPIDAKRFLRLDGSCVSSANPTIDLDSRRFNRLDAVWLTIWLLFLVGLALLPPQFEWHKQLILIAIGIVQVLENRLISRFPTRGVYYVILLKILLATVIIDH